MYLQLLFFYLRDWNENKLIGATDFSNTKLDYGIVHIAHWTICEISISDSTYSTDSSHIIRQQF